MAASQMPTTVNLHLQGQGVAAGRKKGGNLVRRKKFSTANPTNAWYRGGRTTEVMPGIREFLKAKSPDPYSQGFSNQKPT